MSKKKINESTKHITDFIQGVSTQEYAKARESLQSAVNEKIKEKIHNLTLTK